MPLTSGIGMFLRKSGRRSSWTGDSYTLYAGDI